jgi:hypothetical protein
MRDWIDSHPYVTFFLLCCVLIAAGVLGYLASTSGARGQASSEKLPPVGTFIGRSSPWDTRIVALDKEALDNAYRDQIEKLFSVWMRDDSGQPERAITGARQARRAYILVRTEIEKRAIGLGFHPDTDVSEDWLKEWNKPKVR